MKREIIKQNDTIRAYDFKPSLGRRDCYCEGTVLAVVKPGNDYHYYLIECTRDVTDGLDEGAFTRVGKNLKIPCRVFNDYPGRVMNLTRI
jgi:hypothetical protein